MSGFRIVVHSVVASMRNRTIGRELALKFLFMRDLRGPEVEDELEDFLLANPFANEARRFAKDLITGYLARSGSIDAEIDRAAENWDLKRMATVDRNILRLAAYELIGSQATPARVVINEAIEIGKKYGSGKTSSFVNGILDRIRRAAENPNSTRSTGSMTLPEDASAGPAGLTDAAPVDPDRSENSEPADHRSEDDRFADDESEENEPEQSGTAGSERSADEPTDDESRDDRPDERLAHHPSPRQAGGPPPAADGAVSPPANPTPENEPR
jgi:transcription antitermination protein NusB